MWDNMPLWGWIVLLVILLAALAYIAYRIYVKRFARKREDVSPEELLPPHEKALMALSQLRDEKLWQGGREKEYYTHLTDILREYLSGRFGIQAMEMTSSQIVEALRSNQETRLLNKQMKEILDGLKNMNVLEPVVTLKSALNDASMEQLEKLADAIAASLAE